MLALLRATGGGGDAAAEGGCGDEVLEDAKLWKRVLSPASDDAEAPELGDEVSVHYVGTLESGEEFDSSRARGEPFKFRLGHGEVIEGWDKGLSTMRKGERSLLTIGPDLAYGEKGSGDVIPGNATLKFDIELLDFVEGSSDEDEDLDLDGLEDEMDDYDFEDDEDDYGRNDKGPGGEDPEGRYRWERRGVEVVVIAPLKEEVGTRNVKAEFGLRKISVTVQGEVLLQGCPGCELEAEECWWEIDTDSNGTRSLFVHLQKKNATYSKWPASLLKEDS